MARSRRLILSSPSEVWGLLSDGYRYGEWVTGTQQILAADAHWPDVGARLRVRVGLGSLSLDDTCVVRICEPRRRLELEAKAGPFGAARIVMNLIPWGEHTVFVLDWHPLQAGHPGPQHAGRIAQHGLGHLALRTAQLGHRVGDQVQQVVRLRRSAAGRRLTHRTPIGSGTTQ